MGYEAIAVPSPAGNGALVFAPKSAEETVSFLSPTGFVGRRHAARIEFGPDDVEVQAGGWIASLRSERYFVPDGRRLDDPALREQLRALAEPPKIDIDAILAKLDGTLEERDAATEQLRRKGVHHLERLRREIRDTDAGVRIEAVVRELELIRRVPVEAAKKLR